MSRVDVVVFGATGFTGKHAVEQLARLAGPRVLSWALAGRSRQKLQRVLQEVSEKTGLDLSSTKLLIADVQDEQSVLDMCKQGKVLVNCCGPYALYGEVVVKAAIESRTHYVDVSGEPNFIELMRLKYGQAARDAGVYVVSECGFDNIPTDLGVIYLQQNFGGVLNSVECYLNADTNTHSVNFGTWHSLVNCLANFNEISSLAKKIYPTPLPKFTPKLKSRLPIHKVSNGWCLPFPVQNSSTVYHTQRYLYEKAGTRPAQFKLYVNFGSFWNTLAIAIGCIFIYVMSQFKVTKKLLLEKPSLFSFGLITREPSESVIENVRFKFYFYGKGWDNVDVANIDNVPPRKSVIAEVSGVNPGYGMTVLGLLYSAVAILEEPHNMPSGGGVITPGIAFAKTNLVKNLQENGVKFEIVKSKIHQD